MIRKLINLSLLAVILFFASCIQKEIMIDDFESGTYDKWTVEGESFGDAPNQPNRKEVNLDEINGKYIADSYINNDDLIGSIISDEFKIERNYINFMIGGGAEKESYMELIVEGEVVAKTKSVTTSGVLNKLSWNVRQFKGKYGVIRIVDNAKGSWGHILADNIYQSNRDESNIIYNYCINYKANAKYVLIPVQDDAAESSLMLKVTNENEYKVINIRLADKRVDYYVPIDISKYRDKDIALNFTYINKESLVYNNITFSDTYEYEYNEPYRPVYHFSPDFGWTNDPNGMVYYDGEYHLFFQYNPYGTKWGNMHWGHAVSEDLVNWRHESYSIEPDTLGTIFSGSAVIDKDNTSGFGKDAMVAIYTSAGRHQTQSIAYSNDRGRTFTKYEGNPVLSDLKYPDFRDPKVSWHEGSKRWIMTLATGQTITFYGSSNLIEWTRLSEFGEGIGSHDGVWECPDLFPLNYKGVTKWILIVSINPGGPNGGSATQYFIGDFDGTKFKPDNLPYPLWFDYGRDNYAGVTWSNIDESDGRRIFLGWMSNWFYANDVPQVNFRGAMTLPRELNIVHNGKHLIVASSPVEEIKSLRGEVKKVDSFVLEKECEIDNLTNNNNGSFEIEMSVECEDSEDFTLELGNSKEEKVIFIFDLANEKLTVDRFHSGNVDYNHSFANTKSEAPLKKKKSYNIRLFVDKASTEIFIDNGEVVQTNILFPSEPYNKFKIKSESEIKIKSLYIYPIH